MASDLENGIDFISHMPDLVLQLILQGLPNTEEVVRTSVLSTRWRYLWTSIPLFPSLDIDCDRVLSPSMQHLRAKKLEEFVSWALANKTVDLDSFRLTWNYYYNMSTVWPWIDAAMMRKVKKLDLMFSRRDSYPWDDIELPHCLLTCGSLESLRLYLYRSRVKFPDCKGFSALKVLELNSATFYKSDFTEKCLKMCPLLEKLSLIDCGIDKNDILCIPCLKLKTLIIHDYVNVVTSSFNLVVSCPQLVFFKCVGLQVDPETLLKTCPLLEELCLINCIKTFGILKISCLKLKTLIIHRRDLNGWYSSIGLVVSCPELVFFECVGLKIKDPFVLKKVESLKTAVILPQCSFDKQSFCKVLARISHVESLSLDCSSVRYACDPEGIFLKSLPNLKTLELTTTFETYDMKLLIRILTCSPNLESLHLIIQEVCYGSEYQESDRVETMRILSPRLKRVEFLAFDTDKSKLEIAQLLLEHGNALEKMVFSWCNEVDYHEKSMETLDEVSKFHKASSSVKLVTLLKK